MFEGSVLVIDDEEVICSLIKDTLTEKGYSVVFISDAKKGAELVKRNAFDVIFVDLRMPDIDGLTVLGQLKQYDPDNIVIIITGYPSFETIKESMRRGAFDYIAKPFDLEELVFTTRKAVTFRRLNQENKRLMQQITQENIILEKKVLERTEDLRNLYRELKGAYISTVKALANELDARDQYAFGHSENVAKYAVMIAREMGLSPKEIDDIKDACELHNLINLSMHDDFGAKPEKLTAEEWEEVKLHSLKGVEILEPLDFLEGIVDLVRQHYERYDGGGYPNGLKKEAIKLGARIMALAHAFEAMTSPRPYRKKPLTKEEAIEEIKKNSGPRFDPAVVEAFLRITDRM